MSGIIAIVGRPNVGKSALFNRIVKQRIAIVHDTPGVTRDRVSVETEWQGHRFTLIDTGGIGLVQGERAMDVITSAALSQVDLAVEAASAIILVVNVRDGIAPLDRDVAKRLRQSGKPVLLAVNKVDHGQLEAPLLEFAELGFDPLFPVSALHDLGIDTLVTAACDYLPAAAKEMDPTAAPEDATAMSRPTAFKLAIVGRPNVGKSSLINALTQSDRVIVSAIPGTTRDAVDVPFEVETDGKRQAYVLIDTAGLRKKRRVHDAIEFFSGKRAEQSITRADLVVLVLDAEAGITEQDKKIADHITENKKACLIVVNKWDLVEGSVKEVLKAKPSERRTSRTNGQPKVLTTLFEFGQWVQQQLYFIDYAPVIFTSTHSRFNLDRFLEAVRFIQAQLQQTVPTGILNRTINDAVEKNPPISVTGQRIKFFYATQVNQAPPTFLLFVNRQDGFSPAYTRYLSGRLRAAFGFEGCPLILVPKARPKTIESVRKKSLRKPSSRLSSTALEKAKRPASRAGNKSGKRGSNK